MKIDLENIILRLPRIYIKSTKEINSLSKEVFDFIALDNKSSSPISSDAKRIIDSIRHSKPTLISKIQFSSPRRQEELKNTITRYVSRSVYRATPRSGFATYSVLIDVNQKKISTETHHFKFSGQIAELLINCIEKMLFSRGELKLKWHYTCYLVDNVINYVPSYKGDGGETDRLSRLHLTEDELRVINLFRDGAALLDLIKVVPSRFFSKVEAIHKKLYEAGIIVHSLNFNVYDEHVEQWIISILSNFYNNKKYCKIKKILKQLSNFRIFYIDKNQEGDSVVNNFIISYMQECVRLSHFDLPEGVNGVDVLISKSTLNKDVPIFTLDIEKNVGKISLPNNVVSDVGRATSAALKTFCKPHPIYKYFLERFQNLFGNNAISLREALSPHLEHRRYLYELYSKSDHVDKAYGLYLQQALQDLDDIEGHISLESFCENYRRNTFASDYGYVLFVPRMIGCRSGPSAIIHEIALGSGTELFGRFAQHSPTLRGRMEQVHRKIEENNNKATIEVVYQPSVAMRDICVRPKVASYTLYLNDSGGGISCGKQDEIIILDDIVLLVDEELKIFHRKTGEELQAVFNSAHDWTNYTHPVAYQFMCSLAQSALIDFEWPSIFKQLRFLPELRLNNCILSPARWNILGDTVSLKCNPSLKDINSLYRFNNLPHHVWRGATDKKELLDTVDIKSNLIKQQKRSIQLQRAQLEIGELEIDGVGSYAQCEVIANFNKQSKVKKINISKTKKDQYCINIERNLKYYNFNNVLSFKLYGSEQVILESFLNDIAPICMQLANKKIINSWFFIRYFDPDFHIRLRVYLNNLEKKSDIFSLFAYQFDKCIESGYLTKWTFGEFYPEFYRYGGRDGYEIAKQWFHVDSEDSIDLITRRARANIFDNVSLICAHARRTVAICNILLGGAALKHVQETIYTLRNGINNTEQWKRKFLLAREMFQSDNYVNIEHINLTKRHFSILEQILSNININNFVPSKQELCRSLVHMSCNRLMSEWNYGWELVLYQLVSQIMHRDKENL